jgi:DNA-binding beta-propeller fold protein YncE
MVGAVLLVCGALSLATLRSHAQPASTTTIERTDVEVLAAFEEATALAVDPAGRLYVTDAGTDAVVHLTGDGTVLARYGGPGTQPGAFDGPTDLDPTNGLVLYVADAGNARIQRFARAFQFLEALPVGTEDAQPSYGRQGGNASNAGTGQPIAVAVSDADALYVIDAVRGHVVQWGLPRREPRIIGGFDAGPDALVDPVDLAVDTEGQLYVADRGRDAIVIFDIFGNVLTTLAEGLAARVEALRIVGGALWLIEPDAVQMIGPSGVLGRRWSVRLDAPLVDAARYGAHTYLLTSNQLVRWTRAGAGH